jgi:hypothetical protein
LPEWLIERGIGETRAALVDKDQIVETRIEPEGTIPAGSVIQARLASTGSHGRNAIAIDEDSAEYLLPKGAPGVTQGATLKIEVTRSAIAGGEPWKRALARASDKGLEPIRPLGERLGGRELVFPGPLDELERSGWSDVLEQARHGIAVFAGGELRISPTPAMTLIDIDGYLPPEELGLIGAAEAALAIRRLDIGGSIGIDLPTMGSKSARQAAAEAIDEALPQPFERTAVNGFGFIQVVRPRSRSSLVELAQDCAPFEARALLRRVAFEGAGPKRLVGHPALVAALEMRPEWLEALSYQVGGAISLRADPNLPISGGYAEAT